ncbi:DotH/IcmK family type IV secretion protein [Leisingera caerulea]|uniref:DotH/IcmK family type IV secretion protein n=1 Tax=Leisingera caerulea TaxID=506591 RepID=UPI0003F7DE52|nr:DotH/IcmK family type IV secretion protein [Leisingera caerulea]
MTKTKLAAGAAAIALLSCTGMALAQQNPSSAGTSPAAEMGGQADGSSGIFSGYVPSAAPRGMATGGSAVPAAPTDANGNPLPKLNDGNQLNADKIDGFNQAIENNFPMTPEMVRKFRDIYEANQRALLEREEPDARVDAGFISLEPGETPPVLTLAPSIASVIGFYDVTGQPWPITQYVVGSGQDFEVIQLGEQANNLAMTPLTKVGFTNLVVMLKGQAKPVVMRVGISNETAHFRHDIQIMSQGPNAKINTAVASDSVTEAGSELLLSFLAGVDIPTQAKPVAIQGVDARGWLMGEKVYLRSKHPLMWPAHTNAMSGPDGIRVYEIPRSFTALFSVAGQMVRADVVLP